jgi:hypothetical protein
MLSSMGFPGLILEGPRTRHQERRAGLDLSTAAWCASAGIAWSK